MHDANYLLTAGQSVFVFIHMSSLLSLKEQNTQIYIIFFNKIVTHNSDFVFLWLRFSLDLPQFFFLRYVSVPGDLYMIYILYM